ncbi:SHOCT domain-containing protein [Pseudonocardia oceani]|nr:SHOCT domain-containing protein [Pseudonocardia oceani]
MAGGMVFWWFAAAAVVVLLVVGASVAVAGRRDDEVGSAHDVLAERFARGEIDEEEYRRRTAVLRDDPE